MQTKTSASWHDVIHDE